MAAKLILIAAFSFLGTVAVGADDEKKQPPAGKLGNLDKSKMFEKMDADGDGKVTKDEYKKYREQASAQLKEKAKNQKVAGLMNSVLDKLFEKMDANGDGKVTKDEFEKFQPAGNLDQDKLKGLIEKFKKKN